MYVGPTQLVISTAFGETKPSKAEAAAYTNLSAALTGTFDPKKSASLQTTLLDLSTAEPSGKTMFDVLAESYGAKTSSFNLLAAYLDDS
jgi:hypothetical protein